jgi:hypothetical protein
MLVSFLTYTWTLNIEVICSSETSADFHRTTRCCISEDNTVVFVRHHPRPRRRQGKAPHAFVKRPELPSIGCSRKPAAEFGIRRDDVLSLFGVFGGQTRFD